MELDMLKERRAAAHQELAELEERRGLEADSYKVHGLQWGATATHRQNQAFSKQPHPPPPAGEGERDAQCRSRREAAS